MVNVGTSDLRVLDRQEAIRRKCVHPIGEPTQVRPEDFQGSLCDRWRREVQLVPDRLAVRSSEGARTYADLDQVCKQVAGAILERLGIRSEPVATLLSTGTSLSECFLGILHAGKAFLPLDPSYPPRRIAELISDSGARLLLTDSRHEALAKEVVKPPVDILNVGDRETSAILGTPLPSIPQDTPCWIIYTSGSTGRPKGVVQTHRNTLHYALTYAQYLHVSVEDRLSLLSPPNVASGAHDSLVAFLSGASLFPYDVRQEGPAKLAEFLDSENITIYLSVPTVLRRLRQILPTERKFPSMRVLALVGERVLRSDVEIYRRYFSDHCIFVNRYGTTETMTVLTNLLDKETQIAGSIVAVGYPADGHTVTLLGEDGREAAPGHTGEIITKSDYVAPTYLQGAATIQALLSATAGSERVHATGDLGLRLPNGAIVCLGRVDRQTKINGHRVEPAEVESVLLDLDGIQAAVVQSVEDEKGRGCELVAYLVSDVEDLRESEIRELLRVRLPFHMIPSRDYMTDSLPLLPGGKVDRMALEKMRAEPLRDAHPSAAPADFVEGELVKLWESTLERQQVGVTDDFFGLGGDSLAAVVLLAEVNKLFDVDLPTEALYDAPTPKRLAEVLRSNLIAASSASIIPLQPEGSKPPLFFVAPIGYEVFNAFKLPKHLGEDQPLYGVHVRLEFGEGGSSYKQNRVMLQKLVNELLAVQPTGPKFLSGYSSGGLVAFDIACMLLSQGQEVALVALIDSRSAGYVGRDRGRYYVWRIWYDLHQARHLGSKAALKFLRARMGAAWVVLRNEISVRLKTPAPATRDARSGLSRYPDRVVMLGAKVPGPSQWYSSLMGWERLVTNKIELRMVPGDHISIWHPDNVGTLVRELEDCLRNAQES